MTCGSRHYIPAVAVYIVSGRVHLRTLVDVADGRLKVAAGQLLCKRSRGWHERQDGGEPHCQRCEARAKRLGIMWPPLPGQPLSRTTYAALFAAIGNTYGAAQNRTTTFKLPDLKNKEI
jgi:hypothetical protein